jgi:hypothetical protein
MHFFVGTIMLHEAMHIANLTRRANGDRYIDDLMMDYVQYHKRMDGGVDGVPMTGTAYGPLLCKVLARTVKAGIGDLITQNGIVYVHS